MITLTPKSASTVAATVAIRGGWDQSNPESMCRQFAESMEHLQNQYRKCSTAMAGHGITAPTIEEMVGAYWPYNIAQCKAMKTGQVALPELVSDLLPG